MILLKNGTYIDWQTLEFSKTDILVEEGSGGKIHHPSPSEEGSGVRSGNPLSGVRSIDCTGKYITKSFANGHHHVYSALACGMPAPKKSPENFNEILQYIWWNLDKALDLEIIHSSALVTAIACAKRGVSFVIDHHASPFAVEGSLETIAAAFDEVGVGHLLCYEISDRDGMDIAEKGLSVTENYLKRQQGLVGLHASFTVGDQTLEKAIKLARNTNSGIHIHVAEAKPDQDHCRSTYGMRVIERLSAAGALDFPKTILGHCIHIDDNERTIVEKSPSWVVQNMESNLNNRVGFFNSEGLGERIMLGTDGMHSDMLQSARAAFFAGHNFDRIDYAGTYKRLRNVHHYLAGNGFSGDGDNNLVVMDYPAVTPFESSNFPGHLLFGFDSRNIVHLISKGKMILENGICTNVDEAAILEESQRQAACLWKRMA